MCIKLLAAVPMQYPVSCRLTLKGEDDTMEFATKCIHEIGAADATGSVTPAIYLSSTFAHPKLCIVKACGVPQLGVCEG